MRKNEGLMKIVVVAIVFFALTSVAMSVGAESGCTQFEVPPTGQWTSSWFGTGISVTSGQTISISASGTIQPSTSRDLFAGPDGTFEVDYWQTSYSFRSDWGHEALIARIGAAGDPIFIGTRTTFTATTGGEVWLGVNDIDPGNNAGGFVVNVCLEQAPAPDSDGDGVPDDKDQCDGTPAGTEVDEKGCPEEKEEKCVIASADSDGIAQSTNFNIPAGWVGTDVWRHVKTGFMPIEPGAGHTDLVGCQLTGPVNWKGGVTWSGETYGPAAPKTLPAGDYTFNMGWHGKLDTCRLCYTLKRGATPSPTQQRLYPVADGEVYAYSYRNWNWVNTGMYETMGAGWHPTGGEKRAYLRFDLPGGLDASTPEEKCVIASADSDGIAQSTNFNIPAGWVGTDVWRHVGTGFMPIEPGAGHTDQVGCQLTGPVNWKGGVTWSGETYGPAAPKTLPAGDYTFNMGWHGKLDTCLLYYTLKPVSVPNSRAVLKLYQYHSAGPVHSLGVYRVTSSWEEGTDTYHSGKVEETAAPGELCWMQQPSFDPVPVATFTSATAVPAWVEVDITSLVQQWQAGTPNYGLVVKTTNEHPTASDPEAKSRFLTKEHPDQAKCPVLELSSGTAPLPTPSEPPSKQSVCASAKCRIADASEFTTAEFTIGGTEPQKVSSITSHADNFAITAIPSMRIVYRVTDGKSSGSLTLVPGTYMLSCQCGGVAHLDSATVCIEYPVVTGTPPAPTP